MRLKIRGYGVAQKHLRPIVPDDVFRITSRIRRTRFKKRAEIARMRAENLPKFHPRGLVTSGVEHCLSAWFDWIHRRTRVLECVAEVS